MKLRLRLILAFLLLSVVPLGAVTVYSYISNVKALQTAATSEADQLAVELGQRMQLVTTQLSQRVEHLMDLPAPTAPATPAAEPARAAAVAPVGQVSGAAPAALSATGTLDSQVSDALGSAAMLLNTVEIHGLRGPGRGRGGFRAGGPNGGSSRGTPPSAPGTSEAGSTASPTEGPAPPAAVAVAEGASTPPATERPPRFRRDQAPGDQTPPGGRRGRGLSPDLLTPGRANGTPASGEPSANGTPADAADRISIDLGPIARDMFRQFMPEGTDFSHLTPEERQRVATEVNQRMLGIVEGLRLGAQELQRKADAARQKAAADAKTAPAAPAPPAAPLTNGAIKRRAALSGSRLDVTMEQNGKVLRTVNAEVNLPNVLMTVFSAIPRGQGEVPFALGKDGRIYTPSDHDRSVIAQLAPASRPNGTLVLRDWIVVMTADPTGSGLRLGIARPVGDSLNALRRTTGRNAALGLLCVGLAIVGIVPLSGRLTRNLSVLTEGVTRIARGEYHTRVSVKSADEMGALASAVNKMAEDIEHHQRAVIGQERLKRELELGRQIQQDMQPHEPLHLGLTQIQGVSVPAREVGGDFFNYFALPTGEVALLVGDVSGKGVGAALLMANIQASLRTRLAIGQDLAAIADAIDREIEANSPGQMYATLFLGILDPTSRELRYVNAGHHPQYVLHGGAGLEKMGATGLPIGLLAGRGYEMQRARLNAGDLIVFYTDGIVEMENEREEMLGAERFEQLLVDSGPEGPDHVLQHVERALKEFRGVKELFDDATLMAVRVG